MLRTRRAPSAVLSAAIVAATLWAPPADAAEDDDSASWIRTQLTQGIVHNDQYDFDDYGLTIDAAFAMSAIDGQYLSLYDISDAMEPHVLSYSTDTDFGGTDIYAGATAKAALLAIYDGEDPQRFGGLDLQARLEARVSKTAPIKGRIKDKSATDYANTIGQAYAAEVLSDVDSPLETSALNFLLKQQCTAGYFRLNFTASKIAPTQSCDGGNPTTTSAPDVDATAIALLALGHMSTANPSIADAIKRGRTWLKLQQRVDGSFGGGLSTEASNANSSGLAARALGASDSCLAASRAAEWVAALQVVNPAVGSVMEGEGGAIAYDETAMTTAQSAGITVAARDQWRRTTMQAAPALSWRLTNAALSASGPTKFVQGGWTARLTLVGVPDGGVVCITGPKVDVRFEKVSSGSMVSVAVPKATGIATYVVHSRGGTIDIPVHVLGPLKIPFTLKASVSRGSQQVVRASGLESGEKVKVRFRGDVVASGVASPTGEFVTRFNVIGPRGLAEVKVTGEFPRTRLRTTSFKVT